MEMLEYHLSSGTEADHFNHPITATYHAVSDMSCNDIYESVNLVLSSIEVLPLRTAYSPTVRLCSTDISLFHSGSLRHTLHRNSRPTHVLYMVLCISMPLFPVHPLVYPFDLPSFD